MPQVILQPNDAPEGVHIFEGPLSQKELKFGKVLDLTQLLPGDLLLVCACEPGLVGRAIRQVQQRGGYLSEHAQWEHAAIYIGKGVICEATRGGVRRSMLSKYVGDHFIRVRRNLTLSIEQRYETAIHALAIQGFSYDFWEIFRLWKSARFGFGDSTKANVQRLGTQYPKRATICSQLYADCHTSVTKIVIGNLDGGETTPACLSTAPLLTDVRLRWLAIPNLDINPSAATMDATNDQETAIG